MFEIFLMFFQTGLIQLKFQDYYSFVFISDDKAPLDVINSVGEGLFPPTAFHLSLWSRLRHVCCWRHWRCDYCGSVSRQCRWTLQAVLKQDWLSWEKAGERSRKLWSDWETGTGLVAVKIFMSTWYFFFRWRHVDTEVKFRRNHLTNTWSFVFIKVQAWLSVALISGAVTLLRLLLWWWWWLGSRFFSDNGV